MGYTMNKPSMIEGTKGHKDALKASKNNFSMDSPTDMAAPLKLKTKKENKEKIEKNKIRKEKNKNFYKKNKSEFTKGENDGVYRDKRGISVSDRRKAYNAQLNDKKRFEAKAPKKDDPDSVPPTKLMGLVKKKVNKELDTPAGKMAAKAATGGMV